MVWEGVPWMVAGGNHTAEVGRVLAYIAANSGEGIVSPGDCRVVASAIPDGNINIQPGAVACLNRFAGGSSQGYLVRNVGNEIKALTPQGSSGVRYDLVALVIEDPQYAGQPAPASVPNGPYVRTRVFENVGANVSTLAEVAPNQSGYALARVKFDASDGTVNQADITDLRQLVNPRTVQYKRMLNVTAGTTNLAALAVSPPGASWSIPIPPWATRVQLEAQWSGIVMSDDGADGGTAGGHGQVALGTIVTQNATWNQNAIGPGSLTRMAHMAADDLEVPAILRGTSQNLQAKLSKTTGAGMTAKTDPGSTVVVTATFYEQAGTGL